MGNLNCFSSQYNRKRSRWFNEWQNNSSYTNPYDYYDREYYERMKSTELQTDAENFGYYQPNPNYDLNGPQMTIDGYNLPIEQYSQDIYNDNAVAQNNGCEEKNVKRDDVTEAFMSDWFAREEAELNINIKALEDGDSKSHTSVDIPNHEMKPKTKKVEKKLSQNDSESKSSSDSGMCDLDNLTKNADKGNVAMGFSTKKNGYCCYTAYIMCNNTAEWDSFLAKTARIMTGLQRQFQCKIRFSDKICFHRGNSVRTFQIIGSNKGNVIRCKVALPQGMVKLMITPMSGSNEVEEYSKECNITRDGLHKRKLLN